MELSRSKALIQILLVIFIVIPSISSALDCSESAGMAAARRSRQEWSRWCSDCGGIVRSGPRCDPGSNWGGRQQTPSYETPPSVDTGQERLRQQEADQNRQRALEEQRRKEDEEVKKKQEQFEHDKQEALKSMKGIAGELGMKETGAGDMGLKGVGGTAKDGLGLKGVSGPASTPVDSSVVDLRHLDPNLPITVDPNVVKGTERKISVQTSLETLKNANYNKGFDALRSNDPVTAIEFFKKAQKERPGDLMVKNALLLADDLRKVKQNKIKDKKIAEMKEAYSNCLFMAMFDKPIAKECFQTASEKYPESYQITEALEFMGNYHGPHARPRTLEDVADMAEKGMLEDIVFSNTLISVSQRDYKTAIRALEDAQALNPNNADINNALKYVKSLERYQKSIRSKKR